MDGGDGGNVPGRYTSKCTDTESPVRMDVVVVALFVSSLMEMWCGSNWADCTGITGGSPSVGNNDGTPTIVVR